MGSTGTTLAVESWTLYALGACLIVSRMISRLITLGSLSKLQLDDWIMTIVLIPFTATVTCANETFVDTSRPDSKTIRTLKTRFALEELQVTTNWLVKACLLILYRRIFPTLTSGYERRHLACTSAYCLVSYLIIQILFPLWCHPVEDYWSLSPNSSQCTTYRNHSITVLTFSITTTLATLILPIPFIPTPRRILLYTLLLLGTFALIAGILARYYVLAHPASFSFLSWYIVETTLLIVFANLPFLSSLITSTNTRQIRRSLSLHSWAGRSYKDTPPLRAQRGPLSSATTRISPLSSTDSQRVERLGSLASTISPLDAEDMWSDASTPISIPPTPVHKLTLTDPPPELKVYWTGRRPSTRDLDLEKAEQQETQWPLR